MCGRFTLRTPAHLIAQAFGLTDVPDFAPRYNIAPTQNVAAVRLDPTRKQRKLAFLRWGLIPSWADDPKIGNRLLNARADTVAKKPSFRRAFRSQRCLIVADGFYEWQKQGTKKQPFHISLKDGRPFAIAGLWEHWGRAPDAIESCTLITTDANDLMRPIHDRMPVIIAPRDYERWLDASVQTPEDVQSLLRPYPPEEMQATAVSTVVNSPRNEVPECIQPVESPARLG